MSQNDCPDPWSSTEHSLRPVVFKRTPSIGLTALGATGDITQSVATVTIWADPADHTKTFGQSPNGFWRFGTNLFAEFTFPTQASFLVGYLGTIQSGTVQVDLELLDSSSTVLTSGSTIVTYIVNCTSFPSFDYTITLNSQTIGSQVIPQWNAVRVRSTCSNTNLSSLLNYGPLGTSPDPAAQVFYPVNALVGNMLGVG
jgi:hypothetical protein